MKNRNKFLSVILLVVLTLLLVSCNRKAPGETEKINTFLVDGQTEQTFVDTFPADNQLSLDFNIWVVLENGAVSEIEIKNGKFYSETGEEDKNGINVKVEDSSINADGDIKTYTLKYSDSKGKTSLTEFKQYLIDDTATDAVGVAVNYDARALTHHQGNTFDGSGLEVYLLKADGTNELLANEDVTFEGSNYHPRGGEDGEEYINFASREIQVKLEGYPTLETVDFEVRIAGGREPLHSKTASIWNWIFLQIPLAYVASFVGSITGGSLAVAIIITTILVRTLAWPIYAKTNDMSMKMALAQPDMTKVQNKYATRKDPESQQKMQMELMAVYKKHNINMFGCLLPLLQMPIFLAMFQVVSRIAIPGGQFAHNVTKTTLLGIELSDATGISWVNFLFAAIVGSTMFLLQRISAKKPSYAKKAPAKAGAQGAQSEQTMKMVSYFMIFMMVFASFSQRSLAFYWIIGNIYSIIQTLINKHLNEVKYQRIQDEKLYGKSLKERKKDSKVIDAEFTQKDDNK